MHLLPFLIMAFGLLNTISAGPVESKFDNDLPAECDSDYCKKYYDVCFKQHCDPRDFHQVDCRPSATKDCSCKTAKENWVSNMISGC